MLETISNDGMGGYGGRKKGGMGQSQVVVKTVILAPDCDLSDEALMQENETIANPTNKKNKAEVSMTPKQETPMAFFMPSKMLINENTPTKQQQQMMKQEDEMVKVREQSLPLIYPASATE